MRSQLNNHEYRIENHKDDFQRLQLNSNLRIVGFLPHHNNYPSLERIFGKNKTTGNIMPTATILMHSQTPRHKKAFYSHYLNRMPLNPTRFGLPEDKRIVIGENLTRRNASLFKQAQAMKKTKIIAQTFTEDGLVKIKMSKNQPAVIIRTPCDLEFLVAQHEMLQNPDATHNIQLAKNTPSSAPIQLSEQHNGTQAQTAPVTVSNNQHINTATQPQWTQAARNTQTKRIE